MNTRNSVTPHLKQKDPWFGSNERSKSANKAYHIRSPACIDNETCNRKRIQILCTLLHGKPHTDKTLLVEALAHNYNGNFYPVSQSDVNQYGMRNVFEMAKEKLLETDSHSIIFSDGAERVIVNNCNHWEFSAFRTTVDSKHVEAKKLLVLLLHSQVHQLYWNTS